MTERIILTILALSSVFGSAAQATELLIRPHPQIIQPSGGGFRVTAQTKIIIPKDWPPYVRVSAEELAAAIEAASGLRTEVVEPEHPEFKNGNITIGPYEWFAPGVLPWIEPAPQGIDRPAPPEGYNLRVIPDYAVLAGNSERGCFMGLQTLIQTARQTTKAADGSFSLPGLFISDWPDHAWRTLQHPFGVYGTAYERGEHFYRHITRVDLLERSVRLAAHNKLTGLVVEVGTGMTYDRHPEIFVEGFATNDKEKVRAAVDLAKSLGLELTPFQNLSAGHDIWLGPWAYAVPNGLLYEEAVCDILDETIETFRPGQVHIGMDEDVARDYDDVPLREPDEHARLMQNVHDFLCERGVRTLVWNDGLDLSLRTRFKVDTDIVVLPWYYGGNDFSPARRYVDLGHRILCSPWSQWHVENDQFYSIYAASLKSDKCLGMAGTVWYPISSDPGAENDYRRCLVKAADAFWNPLQAGDYPNDSSYFAPDYTGLPGPEPGGAKPEPVQEPEMQRLIEVVTGVGDEHFACEAARERLVSAGTAIVPALLEKMALAPDSVSPWAEGTLRRIVREPVGDTAVMLAAIEKAAAGRGRLRWLALQMAAAASDLQFLAKQDAADSLVCSALGRSGDRGFIPALLEKARQPGPSRGSAVLALGRLKAEQELLSLADQVAALDQDTRETYARALGMCATEPSLPVLGKLSEDPYWITRIRAAMAMGATRSPKAGPYILKLLDDKSPSVFKIGLWWCTDTLILRPEEYFPKLVSRLSVDEPEEIVRPMLHAMILMWNPGLGQWLAKGEDPAKRLDYPKLSVWKDRKLARALRDLLEYKDHRIAIDAMMVVMIMGGHLPADQALRELQKFSIEDKRWFCIRMRDDGTPEAIPILRKLWDTNDRLVQTFILQYASRVNTQAAFDLLMEAYSKIPEKDADVRMGAVASMTAHVAGLDARARRAIPLILEFYDKGDLNTKLTFDAALCRASGRPELKTWDNDPAWFAKRLAEWKDWWAKQVK